MSRFLIFQVSIAGVVIQKMITVSTAAVAFWFSMMAMLRNAVVSVLSLRTGDRDGFLPGHFCGCRCCRYRFGHDVDCDGDLMSNWTHMYHDPTLAIKGTVTEDSELGLWHSQCQIGECTLSSYAETAIKAMDDVEMFIELVLEK